MAHGTESTYTQLISYGCGSPGPTLPSRQALLAFNPIAAQATEFPLPTVSHQDAPVTVVPLLHNPKLARSLIFTNMGSDHFILLLFVIAISVTLSCSGLIVNFLLTKSSESISGLHLR